ncbi:MAG TPA: hypothetical protein VJ783_01000 [Pirellulales bacterium]|nr:hypothetical protein [Pirellulales bacterium]
MSVNDRDPQRLSTGDNACRERPPWRSAGGELASNRSSRNATEGVPYRTTRRRWFQFSLRGMLLLMLAAFAGLGYYADQVHRQQTAAVAIHKLGGRCGIIEDGSDSVSSRVQSQLTRWFGVDATQTIRHVYLGGCTFSDDDLTCLAGLPHLRTLILTSTPLTDAGLAHLRGLKLLTFVDLRFTRVTPEGVERLRGWLPAAKIVYRSDID